jgi:hypothetical protein
MLDFLDWTLKNLLQTKVLPLVTVSVDPPDDSFRNTVAQSAGNYLNVYLVELRENRKLRSNDLLTDYANGVQQERMAPSRVDCHYLVSAWSPATINPTPLIDGTIDEHGVLYQALDVLVANSPLNAKDFYPGTLGVPPDALVQQPLPTVVVPPDGFPKLPDFWMRMKDWLWKPVIELVVTLPVVALPKPSGSLVTTVLGRIGQRDQPTTFEDLVVIGGLITTPIKSVATPVAGAWVRLVELHRMVATNVAGQFVFASIPKGNYTLEAGARGLTAKHRAITVPSLSGEYDLGL